MWSTPARPGDPIMPGMFSIEYFAVGFIGLAIGAAAGEVLARNAPRHRQLISVAVFFMIAVAVITGVRLESVLDGAMAANAASSIENSFAWVMTRQMGILGFLCGVQAALVQRRLPNRLIALGAAGVIGVPILTNISFGIGVSSAGALI